jgi:hypothetical protein
LALAGKVAGVNPEAFKIIDGKLYLSWSKKGAARFAEKADKAVKMGDENWAKLHMKN